MAIYVCDNCGRQSEKFFGLCDKCFQGTGELMPESAKIENKDIISAESLEIKKIDPEAKDLSVLRKTPFAGMDSILSTAGGFVEGQVALMGANPGIGKSIISNQMVDIERNGQRMSISWDSIMLDDIFIDESKITHIFPWEYRLCYNLKTEKSSIVVSDEHLFKCRFLNMKEAEWKTSEEIFNEFKKNLIVFMVGNSHKDKKLLSIELYENGDAQKCRCIQTSTGEYLIEDFTNHNSTLCTSLATDDESVLYISSEENYIQVNKRFLRVNPESRPLILSTTSIDETLLAIKTTKCQLIIIDSINSMESGASYAAVSKYTQMVTELIKKLNKCCIIISQVNRDGEITGMQSTIHIVDTVLYLERGEHTKNIILVSTKNRFGEIGEIACFEHRADGFIETNINHRETEAEVGTSFAESRFGHKNINLEIQALTCPSVGGYPIRRSIGYDTNRIVQIIGILQHFGKLDFSQRDIYINIGDGLNTTDINIELSIVNAVLSSYFMKSVIFKSQGYLKLNGKILGYVIKNNEEKEEEISHINELIQMYK